MKYTVLLLMQAMPAWLQLSRDERATFFNGKVMPLINKYQVQLSVRLFDAEYFHSTVSDFMMIETEDMEAYADFIENLRDTDIYSIHYFNVRDIIVGIENRFKTFDERLKNENN